MTSHGADGRNRWTKLNRQLLVSCFLTAGLLFATAPHVLAHPAPNTKSNSAAANAANRPAGDQAPPPAGTPADNQANPPAHSQRNPPADNEPGPPAHSQANPPAASQASPPAKAPPRRANPHADEPDPSGNNPGRVGSAQPAQAGGKGEGGGATTDPAGNNGTVKVDMNGDTTTRNNEAQGDCQGVTIKLFNFDGGEAITITFSGQAPTEFTALATHIVTADADGNQATSFSLDQIVPLGTAPAPNGGYHVRIEANGLNHPAGIKTKVFWLRCDTFGLVGSEAADSTVTPTPVQVRGVLIKRSAPSKVAGTQQVRLAKSPAAAGVNRALRARVLGTTVERAALARTGFDAMHLVTLGGLAIFAGYAALRVSRRNSKPSSSLIADR